MNGSFFLRWFHGGVCPIFIPKCCKTHQLPLNKFSCRKQIIPLVISNDLALFTKSRLSEKYVSDSNWAPKSLINVQKEKEIFVVACLFTSSIKFRERSSGARPRVGPQFAEISARATGILASRPARLLIKNKANFMRQQGMSQASPVKAGQPR